MFARKIDTTQATEPPSRETDTLQQSSVVIVNETISDHGTDSPARALQEHLKAKLEAPADMSARRVAAMFFVVCLSCWLAGIGLYSLL